MVQFSHLILRCTWTNVTGDALEYELTHVEKSNLANFSQIGSSPSLTLSNVSNCNITTNVQNYQYEFQVTLG